MKAFIWIQSKTKVTPEETAPRLLSNLNSDKNQIYPMSWVRIKPSKYLSNNKKVQYYHVLNISSRSGIILYLYSRN